MNIFRLAGDMLHLLAIIVLLVMILKTRSYAGISGKSQLLFVIVYVTRYSDIFTTYINMYITVMKILYLLASLSIVLLMVIFRKSYNRKLDTFRIEFLLIPAAILALLFNYDFITLEILWTFSIYLEAVAILPQLLNSCCKPHLCGINKRARTLVKYRLSDTNKSIRRSGMREVV
uniref:ER lumen protein-retaining receptor n=1 Tax=Phlebotomus papatasi TaxID=29031 RepID=A0A1B0D1H4_PHLPP